jgi:hypothetical protein
MPKYRKYDYPNYCETTVLFIWKKFHCQMQLQMAAFNPTQSPALVKTPIFLTTRLSLIALL